MITPHDLFDALDRAGLRDRTAARRIIVATLVTLGERLTDDERHALANALADELRPSLTRARYTGDFDAATFYDRVRHRARVSAGIARENAQVVVEAIGRGAPDELLRPLERALPPEIASLLHGRDLGEPPPPSPVPHGNTLADGRPGQSHSIARESNPHGGTKLSSGKTRFPSPISEGWRR